MNEARNEARYSIMINLRSQNHAVIWAGYYHKVCPRLSAKREITHTRRFFPSQEPLSVGPEANRRVPAGS